LGLLTLGRGASPVGLDIGSSTFRLAQLKPSNDKPTLISYASAQTPDDLINEGEIMDVDGVAKALSKLWREHKIREKNVVVGVANQKVIVRVIEMPYMTETELRSAIQYQINDYIPIPIEEAIVDFQIIGERESDEGERMMEVLVVAARRDMVESTIAAVEKAGLNPVVIDVSSLAFARAVTRDGVQPFIQEDINATLGATAMINISANLTDIVVIEDEVPRFTRISNTGGNTFTEALVEQLGISFEDAEDLKIKIGLAPIKNEFENETPAIAAYDSERETEAEPMGFLEISETSEIPETSETSGILEAPETLETPETQEDSSDINKYVDIVQSILEQEMTKFIAEIRRSLDYYLVQATRARHIDKIIVSGGGAKLKNFMDYLKESLQLEVELGRPLNSVQLSRKLRRTGVEDEEPSMAICLGLAMRGIDR